MDRNLNALSYWHPFIERSGVRSPKTQIISSSPVKSWAKLYDGVPGVPPEGSDEIARSIISVAQAEFGLGESAESVFLRCEHTSGKHEYAKTCHLQTTDLEKVRNQMLNIVCYAMMASLAGMPIGDFVVREMIPLAPHFYAFEGMPVTKECRLLWVNGKLDSWYPYWPPEAFIKTFDPIVSVYGGTLPPEDWGPLLESINRFSEEEVNLVAEMAKKVCEQDGMREHDWSIDFIKDSSDQWHAIDMARAEDSWVWEEMRSPIKTARVAQI